MKIALRLLLTLAMAVACVWAQRSVGTGGSTGTSTGGTSTTGGTTTGTTIGPTTGTTPTISPAPTTPAPTVAAPSRPVFLSGNVSLDDGSPLPGSVNIQSVCASRQRIVAHTSPAGDFGFQWAVSTGFVFEDASENGRPPGSSSPGSGSTSSGTSGSSGSGSRLADSISNCDLRADLPGYTSSTVSLFNREGQENFDVGTILLHRITGDEGHVVSLLSLKAPKDAKKSFDKGAEQVRAGKPGDAAASFKKAVAAYPQYADAWLSLGRVEAQTGAPDAARTDFQKAMDLDDKLAGPWQELGFMASDQHNWEQAARYLDQAVRLDPMSSAKPWYFSAMANYNLGRFDVAERSIRADLKLDTGNPHGEYLLGLVLIARKDLKGGADVLRSYIASAPKSDEVESAKKQLSRVESQLGQ